MEIRYTFFILLLAVINISGCTPSEDNCLTIDQVTQLKKIKIDNKEHYLFLRISGWHDKIELFNLYDQKPVFDKCMNANIPPISDISVYPENGTASKLLIENKILSLEYTKEKTSNSLENIAVEII